MLSKLLINMSDYPRNTPNPRLVLNGLVFLLCLCFIACGGGNSESPSMQNGRVDASTLNKTSSGIPYVFHQKNEERVEVKADDFFTFHLLIKQNDTTLRNTYLPEPQPIRELPFNATYFIGRGYFKEVFEMLSPGDSISFWINADSLQKQNNSPNPAYINNQHDIEYTVKVLEIKSSDDIRQQLEEHLKAQREIDQEKIKAYLEQDSLSPMLKTESGLHYHLPNRKAKGISPSLGDTVMLHYTGKLLDGQIYDSSVDKGATEFVIGNTLPEGFNEALLMMHVGERGTFIIPSELGFGVRGMGRVVPPNSVLIFEVELLKIK